MEQIMQYLPFLIPVFILQLVLMITALVHILRHDHYKKRQPRAVDHCRDYRQHYRADTLLCIGGRSDES